MKNKSRKFIIIALIIVAVKLGAVTTIYAWFMDRTDKFEISGMGIVKVEVSKVSEVSDDGKATFEILNHSTIDTYMRLGWTPVYKDIKTGEELVLDVSQIEIEEVTLSGFSGEGINLSAMGMSPLSRKIETYNGYKKRMITIEDNDGKYFVVPAGTNINCQITFTGISDIKNNSGLYVILVPEALQATKKAVIEAELYGWDGNKADKQAGSVVLKGGAQ